MADGLTKLANNPLVALAARGFTALGVVLASLAVFIFMDTRTTQAEALKSIAADVKQVRDDVLILKGESAVSNVKIDELRDRLKSVERKVFQ